MASICVITTLLTLQAQMMGIQG